MSSERYDGGQALWWQPFGIYHFGQNIAAAPATLINLSTGGGDFIWRIDYASLVLRFLNPADGEVWAEMSILTDPGSYIAFLAASYPPNISDELSMSRVSSQLSLPFITTGDCAIVIRGGVSSIISSDSNYDGTVAVSRSIGY